MSLSELADTYAMAANLTIRAQVDDCGCIVSELSDGEGIPIGYVVETHPTCAQSIAAGGAAVESFYEKAA
jgi:hypothetical protein